MFSGLGVPELIIILIVVLIIFGPKNLPKLGETIGKTVKNFRNESEKGEANTDSADKPAEAPAPVSDSVQKSDAATSAPAPTSVGSTNKEEK